MKIVDKNYFQQLANIIINHIFIIMIIIIAIIMAMSYILSRKYSWGFKHLTLYVQ